MNATLIDCIRHGEPIGGRRYRGDAIDDPLSEKGWEQMWRSVGTSSGWDRIVSSPMQRCLAFAESLAGQRGIPLSVERDLREVGMGAWEGRTPQEILEQEPEAYAAFYRDPVSQRPPGCEPLDRFGTRVAGVFETLINTCAHQHVLVVAHAGVIRAAVGHVMRSDPVAWYRLRVDNAGVTRLRRDEFGWRLEFHNRPALDP